MLDFSRVATQIQSFTKDRVRAIPLEAEARAEAERRLREANPAWEITRDKINISKTSWLLAEWLEPPEQAIAPPPRPMPHTVLAADGSQIVSDRHDIALCYLINVGMIALRYGTGERALLHSRPHLDTPDDDLLDEFQGEQSVIAPRRLAMRRLLAEFAGLAEMIESHAAEARPTLALSDGTLILWPLESEKPEFRAESLRDFETHLATAQQNRVPVVGYISQSNSRDVVNSLRIYQCPYEEANCDKNCPGRNKPKPLHVIPDCAGTERITDADLFFPLLRPGERSAVFGSRSKILDQYEDANRIRFFYLHTGREVARVEIPDWVATDKALLDMTHSLCYDQAQKGDGYPVALAEAHEQATVRAAEKEAFFRLMERGFVSAQIPVAATQKAVSKRARRV